MNSGKLFGYETRSSSPDLRRMSSEMGGLRWLWSRRYLRNVGLFIVAACFVTMRIMSNPTVQNLVPCVEAESRGLLNQLCKDYHAGHQTGALCPALCDTKTLKFNQCINHHVSNRGGKFVFVMDYGGQQAILKCDSNDYKPLPQNNYQSLSEITQGSSASFKQFERLVATRVRREVMNNSAQTDSQIVNIMWGPGYKEYLGSGVTQTRRWAAMEGLWSLLHQNEFILLQYLQDYEHLLTIHGSCGSFYLEEMAPPGHIYNSPLNNLLFWRSPSWEQRAKLALKLLDLVEYTETKFPEPLHLCDLTPSNLGVGRDGEVRAIDVDTSFLDTHMSRVLQYGLEPTHRRPQACQKHEDCSFDYCEGWCNLDTGSCTPYRINNNLQVMCNYIFSSEFSNFYSGLLRRPPRAVASELNDLVYQCVNPPPPHQTGLPGCKADPKGGPSVCPHPGKRTIHYKTGDEVLVKLKDVLARSLKSS